MIWTIPVRYIPSHEGCAVGWPGEERAIPFIGMDAWETALDDKRVTVIGIPYLADMDAAPFRVECESSPFALFEESCRAEGKIIARRFISPRLLSDPAPSELFQRHPMSDELVAAQAAQSDEEIYAFVPAYESFMHLFDTGQGGYNSTALQLLNIRDRFDLLTLRTPCKSTGEADYEPIYEPAHPTSTSTATATATAAMGMFSPSGGDTLLGRVMRRWPSPGQPDWPGDEVITGDTTEDDGRTDLPF